VASGSRDDGQPEADARVAGADAAGAAPERLGEGGDQLRGELLAGVLDGEHDPLGVDARADAHSAPAGSVVDDRVVHEVRGQLQQQRG
jgi:hypothetical protein